MKLNRNGMNNLALIVGCIAVIVLILKEVNPLFIFGIIGAYAIFQGVITIHLKEVPKMEDYSKIKNKNKFCFHTGLWMILLGIAVIAMCVSLFLGMPENTFWVGLVLIIVAAFIYNFVIKRIYMEGYRSNIEQVIDMLKNSKR